MYERRQPYRSKRGHPPGMTLIELLVVMAIIATLGSLMTAAVFRGIIVARTTQCTQHLRNLGLGLHMYQEVRGCYPCEVDSGESFYLSLLDAVEAGAQLETVRKDRSAAEPVRAFLCPARRDISVGAKCDYAYGSSPSGLCSILGSDKPVSLSMILAGDGPGNTMLLAHKALSPRDYSGGSDGSWADKNNGRDPGRFVKDSNDEDMSKLIGSPHPHAMPALFADTSVRKVPYDLSSQNVQGKPVPHLLWSYNDGKSLGKHLP